MADPMEMSLDDIIKKNRSTRGRRGRGRGAAAGNGAARQSRGGAGGQRGQGMRRGARPQQQFRSSGTASAASVPTSGHIVISNLDFQVSDGDLQELFGEFGSLKKAAVHFNSQGKSQGSADIIFTRYQDAIRAMQKYNGVPLDGRPMRIAIASSELAQAMSPQRQRNAGGAARGRGGRGGRFGGRGGNAAGGGGGGQGGGRGRGRGRGGSSSKPMTKEQLDAEIDAYHTQSEAAEA